MEQPDHETLSNLGYRIYGDILLRDKYEGMREYYIHLLTTGSIIEIEQVPTFIILKTHFYTTLHQLENQNKLLKCAPKTYLTAIGMQQHGITPEAIVEFQRSVQEKISNGTFFTIPWLREHTNIQLPGDGLSDYAYGSMLVYDRGEFSATSIFGELLLMHGRSTNVLADFLKHVLTNHGSMSLMQLSELLDKEYGLKNNSSVLAKRLKKAHLNL
jgi:hypothetical protein